MKMPKIKRCPFYGGDATLFRTISQGRWQAQYYTRVMCDICGSQGKSYRSSDDPADGNWETYECYQAICAWNMRTPEKEENSNPCQP
jgi:hypothetical protein